VEIGFLRELHGKTLLTYALLLVGPFFYFYFSIFLFFIIRMISPNVSNLHHPFWRVEFLGLDFEVAKAGFGLPRATSPTHFCAFMTMENK
jgi:hypothetical protein